VFKVPISVFKVQVLVPKVQVLVFLVRVFAEEELTTKTHERRHKKPRTAGELASPGENHFTAAGKRDRR
jgi:hypothetical protein